MGELGPAAYDRQLVKHTEAIEAATAQHDQLKAHADELEGQRGNLDSEHETLRRLADLRASIAAKVRTAEARDVDALRVALVTVFERLVVAPERLAWRAPMLELQARLGGPPAWADVDAEEELGVALEQGPDGWRWADDAYEVKIDDLVLIPVVHEDVLRDSDNAITFPEPIRRTPLPMREKSSTGTQVLDQMTTSSA